MEQRHLASIRVGSLMSLARLIQRQAERVLERLARASGFRGWNGLVHARTASTNADEWIAAVTGEFGSDIIDALGPSVFEDHHDFIFPPASVNPEVTGAQILEASCSVRGRRHSDVGAPAVILKRPARTYSRPA